MKMDLGREKLLNLMNRMRSQFLRKHPHRTVRMFCGLFRTILTPTRWNVLQTLLMPERELCKGRCEVLCDDTFEVKFGAATEHYACFLAKQVRKTTRSLLHAAFNAGKRAGGLCWVSFETCTRLTAHMLRDRKAKSAKKLNCPLLKNLSFRTLSQ